MPRSRISFVVAVAAVLGLLVTGCAKSGSAAKQTASVAYAGSLTLVNDQHLGPAFSKATGLDYKSHPGGSFGVANLIKGGEIQPNVFESVGNAPIASLESQFTSWSVGFAAQPLVLVYSPQSPFSSQLKAVADGQKPLTGLFGLMAQPGFHLGRTNPETDPQGQAFIIMLKLAAQKYNLPAGTVDKITGSIDNPKQVFAETAILSRLEAGQLDASSAYLPEAVQRNLPYIQLPDDINLGNPAMAASYAGESLTLHSGKKVSGSPIVVYVTTISGTPDQAAGVSFVKYLLSPAGQNIYRQLGYTLIKPVIAGDGNAIPAEIKSELR